MQKRWLWAIISSFGFLSRESCDCFSDIYELGGERERESQFDESENCPSCGTCLISSSLPFSLRPCSLFVREAAIKKGGNKKDCRADMACAMRKHTHDYPLKLFQLR